MKALTRSILLIAMIFLVACNNDSGGSSENDSGGDSGGNGSTGGIREISSEWAMTVADASRNTNFEAVAVGPDGSIYAVGSQSGDTEVNYGSGVTAAGQNSTDDAVLVKYNADGEAQWARTAEISPSSSKFQAVVVDDDGNVFAAGYQRGGAGI